MTPSLKSRQQELLYGHLPVSILNGYLALILITVVLWKHIDHPLFLIWLVCFNLIMFYRIGILLVYRKHGVEHMDLDRADLLNFVSTLLTGVIWGTLTLYFNPDWPVESQVTLWVLLLALMSGASASFSVNFKYYVAYCGPILLFSFYTLLVTASYFLLIIYVVYAFMLALTGRNFHKAQNQIIMSQIELQATNIQLENLATTDPLTRLPNRRAFQEYYNKEWARHVRSHAIMSLLMIDVDFFKPYNDNYGHNVGDECLVAIANVIKSSLHRPADRVARYGGEEFIVILPETASEGAKEVAERIHATLQERYIRHEYSSIKEYVTVSIGIATRYPKTGEDEKILVVMADRELYKAKAAGRNTTSTHDEEDSI